MWNAPLTAAMASDHRRRLTAAADRNRLVAAAAARRPRLRSRAGWLLVDAGLRLARTGRDVCGARGGVPAESLVLQRRFAP